MSSLTTISEDTPLDELTDVKKWLEYSIGKKIPLGFPEFISEGHVLNEILNKILNGLVPFYYTMPAPTKLKLHPLKQRANLNFFLEGCWRLGVPTHNIFISTDILKQHNLDAVRHTMSALSYLSNFLSKFDSHFKCTSLFGINTDVQTYSIALFELLEEDFEFDQEELGLQSTLCQMLKEILDSLVSGSEIDMDAVDAISENAFAMDSVRRVYLHLLRNLVFEGSEPKEITLTHDGFSILATMTAALLKDLRKGCGGDYISAKLLFDLSFYFKYQDTDMIYLHEVIRDDKLWEHLPFWEELFWDSLTTSICINLPKEWNGTGLYDEKQKKIISDLIIEHTHQMEEWGRFSPPVLSEFIRSIGPLVELSEKEINSILEATGQEVSEEEEDEENEETGEGSDSEEESEDKDEALNEAFSEIVQLKITLKKQEQYIKKLEDTLTQQFLKTISACKSEKLRDKLSHAQTVLDKQLELAASFKTTITGIQEKVQIIKNTSKNPDEKAAEVLEGLYTDIHDDVGQVLDKARKMVESDDMEELKPDLKSEMFEITNDVEDASEFFLEATFSLMGDITSPQVIEHVSQVGKEFDLSLSDFITIVDKVLIEIRLELSRVVIEAIVSQLEAEAEMLRRKNVKLTTLKKTEEDEKESRVQTLEKEVLQLRNSEQAAKNASTQLLTEKVKFLEEQSIQATTIHSLTNRIYEKDKALEEKNKEIELLKLENLEFQKRTAVAVAVAGSTAEAPPPAAVLVSPRAQALRSKHRRHSSKLDISDPNNNNKRDRNKTKTIRIQPKLERSVTEKEETLEKRYRYSELRRSIHHQSIDLTNWRMSMTNLPPIAQSQEELNVPPVKPTNIAEKSKTVASLPKSHDPHKKQKRESMIRVKTQGIFLEMVQTTATKNRKLAKLVEREEAMKSRKSLPVGFDERSKALTALPKLDFPQQNPEVADAQTLKSRRSAAMWSSTNPTSGRAQGSVVVSKQPEASSPGRAQPIGRGRVEEPSLLKNVLKKVNEVPPLEVPDSPQPTSSRPSSNRNSGSFLDGTQRKPESKPELKRLSQDIAQSPKRNSLTNPPPRLGSEGSASELFKSQTSISVPSGISNPSDKPQTSPVKPMPLHHSNSLPAPAISSQRNSASLGLNLNLQAASAGTTPTSSLSSSPSRSHPPASPSISPSHPHASAPPAHAPPAHGPPSVPPSHPHISNPPAHAPPSLPPPQHHPSAPPGHAPPSIPPSHHLVSSAPLQPTTHSKTQPTFFAVPSSVSRRSMAIPEEGIALKSKQTKFEEFKSDRRIRASRGFSELELAVIQNAIAAPNTQTHTHAQILTEQPKPSDAEEMKRKFSQLTDVEFVRTFKMTRMQFNRLPPWRAEGLRRKANLL